MSAKFRFLKSFVNRNPRSMEHARLQRKSDGWDFEKDRAQRQYIYRVDFVPSTHHITAFVRHYEDGVVLEASTREPDVRAQLSAFSLIDVNAARNIGRLLGHRCQMTGILNCTPGSTPDEIELSERRRVFFDALQAAGVQLSEPEHIPHTHLNDPNLVWDRWPSMKHTREDKLDELDLSIAPGKGVC